MEKNGRPTWAEIDLNQLEKNYRVVRSSVPRNTKILAVVKADAYGHGSIETAKRLEQLNVDYFGVAIVEEAVPLREVGIKKPILLLGGFWSGQEEDILIHDLTPAIYHFGVLESLSYFAKSFNKRVRYHLKIDTGMGRVGIPHQEVGEFVRQARRLELVELEGVFTTLSSADKDAREYTQLQIHRFNQAVREIEAFGMPVKIKHAANSAGLLYYPDSWFDMVRPGILLYGVVPGRKNLPDVGPILSLKSRISFLKSAPPGTPIGYGQTFITQRESLIAMIPIGYYDGLNRLLSNQGKVIVRDRFAPIVGSITMDMAFIDVTDIPDVKMDDDVIIIGRSASLSITAGDIAREIHTIPYEVFCGIRKRVPRIYI